MKSIKKPTPISIASYKLTHNTVCGIEPKYLYSYTRKINKPKYMNIENWKVLVIDTTKQLPATPPKAHSFDLVVIKYMTLDEFTTRYNELYMLLTLQLNKNGKIISL